MRRPGTRSGRATWQATRMDESISESQMNQKSLPDQKRRPSVCRFYPNCKHGDRCNFDHSSPFHFGEPIVQMNTDADNQLTPHEEIPMALVFHTKRCCICTTRFTYRNDNKTLCCSCELAYERMHSKMSLVFNLAYHRFPHTLEIWHRTTVRRINGKVHIKESCDSLWGSLCDRDQTNCSRCSLDTFPRRKRGL
jgi:hypothetical protein